MAINCRTLNIAWECGEPLPDASTAPPADHCSALEAPIWTQLANEVNATREYIGHSAFDFSWMGTDAADSDLTNASWGADEGGVTTFGINMVQTILDELRTAILGALPDVTKNDITREWVDPDGTEYSGRTTIIDAADDWTKWIQMVSEIRDMITDLLCFDAWFGTGEEPGFGGNFLTFIEETIFEQLAVSDCGITAEETWTDPADGSCAEAVFENTNERDPTNGLFHHGFVAAHAQFDPVPAGWDVCYQTIDGMGNEIDVGHRHYISRSSMLTKWDVDSSIFGGEDISIDVKFSFITTRGIRSSGGGGGNPCQVSDFPSVDECKTKTLVGLHTGSMNDSNFGDLNNGLLETDYIEVPTDPQDVDDTSFAENTNFELERTITAGEDNTFILSIEMVWNIILSEDVNGNRIMQSSNNITFSNELQSFL